MVQQRSGLKTLCTVEMILYIWCLFAWEKAAYVGVPDLLSCAWIKSSICYDPADGKGALDK